MTRYKGTSRNDEIDVREENPDDEFEDDKISGRAGNDYLYGWGGDDTIDGGTGKDTIYGGAGDDILLGYDGRDLIFGGNGDDRIIGEKGNDTLTGGKGADTFVYKTYQDGDIIEDFSTKSGDIIEIDAEGFDIDDNDYDLFEYNSDTGVLSFDGDQFVTLDANLNFDVENDIQII